MFDNFTDAARSVVSRAEEEARTLGHGDVGPEHLLLALTRDDGMARRALADSGVTTGFAVTALIGISGEGERPHTGHIPFTPAAREVMNQALREALNLGHNYVGTDHLLLAVLAAGEDDTALKVLADLSVGAEAIRHRVLSAMSGDPAGPFEYEILVARATPDTVTLHVDADEATAAAGTEGSVSSGRFTLGRGECFSIRDEITLRDDLRYLDYADARTAAATHGAEVCILTPRSTDVTALAADGTEVVIGSGTHWAAVSVEDRVTLLGTGPRA